MAAALSSMTGFARADGVCGGSAWAWEVRSVNGRGLDLRLRVPPGNDAVETAAREAAQARLKRGNVSATLTVRREEQPRFTPDAAALDHVLSLALDLQRRIPGAPPPRAEALLALPGVLRAEAAASPEPAGKDVQAALNAGFALALDRLVEARQGEGRRLAAILAGLLDEIAALRAQAADEAKDQPEAQRARMTETLRTLLHDGAGPPEERIAQEVALFAARSDVREELDRLASHVDAARALLREGSAVGRRLDFLVQEFNREANTLCSKSASLPLTTTGLRLKAAIEQLREQAANIE